MVNRLVKNKLSASVNFGGEFSGGNQKNTKKSENETEVSFTKLIIFKKKTLESFIL